MLESADGRAVVTPHNAITIGTMIRIFPKLPDIGSSSQTSLPGITESMAE
jgi:hypothetical protein